MCLLVEIIIHIPFDAHFGGRFSIQFEKSGDVSIFALVIPNHMKRFVALIAVVPIAFVLLLSCKRENQDPEPTREVDIEFNHNDLNEQLEKQKIQELVSDKTIRVIYLTTTQHWTAWTAKNIEALRPFLQKRIEMSSKVRGRGDFDFKLGEASKVPSDSLWFTQNGWTINKKYQH